MILLKRTSPSLAETSDQCTTGQSQACRALRRRFSLERSRIAITRTATHNDAMSFPGIRKPITRNDVLWCYRYILRREPESESAITPHLNHKNFRSLAESFARSQEAQQPVTREDVLWCYRHIFGREPNADELADEAMARHLAQKDFRDLAESFARQDPGLNAITRDEVLWGFRHILRREPESDDAVETNLKVASFRQLVEGMGNTEEVVRPITVDDVLWCYRHILGREPEIDETIDVHLAHKHFRELAESFARRRSGLRAVTANDVRWAYKNVLGRDAESNEAIAPHLLHHSYRELIADLANSVEAQRLRSAGIEGLGRRQIKKRAVMGASMYVASLSEAHNVDSVASKDELNACLSHAKRSYLSRGNLAHADASHNAQADSQLVEMALTLMARAGASDKSFDSLLTTGSTHTLAPLLLAKHAQAAYAYELCEPVSELSAARARSLGVTNVVFQEFNLETLKSLPRCDRFYSISSLEWFPPPLAALWIRNALSALLPGGIGIFQVLTSLKGYSFKLADWLGNAVTGDTKRHAIPETRVREIISGQGCELVLMESLAVGADTKDAKSTTFVVRKRAPAQTFPLPSTDAARQ
jgi:hypothetical protein